MNIFVANDKGGVGKSTIAQYCAIRLGRSGELPILVDMDRQPKLHRFFGRDAVHSLPFTGTDQPEREWTGASATWDPVLDWMRAKRPLVVDFGAQAWAAFVQWAQRTEVRAFARTEDCVVLVPTTSDIEAVLGAVNVLKTARAILPGARIAVLACNKDGPIEYLKGTPDFDELLQMGRAVSAVSRNVPVLRSAAYVALAHRSVRFDQIERAAARGIAEIAGLAPVPPTALVRAVKEVQKWLQDMDIAVLPLLSVAPPADQPVQGARAPAPPGTAPASAAAAPITIVRNALRPDNGAPAAPPQTSQVGWVTSQNFDEEYYLRMNPDVAAAVNRREFASGFEHFSAHAGTERRLYRIRQSPQGGVVQP